MKRIGLIACSKHKLGESEPERKFKASEIYTGHTFRIARDIGLKRFNCDDWYILSAEHNLLNKNKKIVYYDRYLGSQSAAYKKEWVDSILSKLRDKYDLENDVFYIFGGSDYYRGLLPYLHCFVFSYKNANTINLDDITEYRFGKRCSKTPSVNTENSNGEQTMIKASSLRNKDALKTIPSLPGYYKWWAARPELDVILRALNLNFSDIKTHIETRGNLFCIYVGIAAKESVRDRLNWHVNDKHTASQVIIGTLSTLRQSISSIVSHNQYDKAATDQFIDKLFLEYFYTDSPIKSEAAKTELHAIETKLMSEYLRLLNIQDNHNPLSEPIKAKLKRLRKESKNTGILESGSEL